jgi:ubiquinone/menaquinone biosynthesis C-methylase UbiE
MTQLKQNYDAWHLTQAGQPPARGLVHPWHKTVAKLLPDLSRKSVLEIGCGQGGFAIWLAQKYPTAHITAVDFSDRAIEIARARSVDFNAGVAFEVGDAEQLRFPNDAFDHILSCECLEHVPQPEKVAREICRVLKPGGGFLLTTENYFNGMVLGWFIAWWQQRPFDSGSGVQPHENFFLFWRVKRLLERAGLKVKHTESNHFQWLLLPRCAPHRLCTQDFNNPWLKRLLRPFGRHFTFQGIRPNATGECQL